MSTQKAGFSEIKNRLLAKLPDEDLKLLSPHMEEVSLTHGQALILPYEPIPYLYFPINSLASLVTVMEDGSTVEAGAVGREGVVGIAVLLDAGTTPMQTLIQIPGKAVRVKAGVVKDVFDRQGALHGLLHRYIHTLFVVASQSAACNRRHRIESRLCRWLLMSSDGIGANELALTQEFLATMLGVRRAGVTEAALELQRKNLIDYNRGHIRILDRESLEGASCECYRMVKSEFDRLLG